MTRPIYHARPDARFYGHAIGIIVLDCVQPNIPGDVANASTYRYPVLFEPVDGLTAIAAKSGDPALEQAVVEAACRLEARGVKAISSNCGFLHRYQEAIARDVQVPVLMSALQQLPMVLAGLSTDAEVGVITADAGMLGDALLQDAANTMLDAVLENLRPGTTSHEVNTAVIAAARAAGVDAGVTKRAGYSVGLNFPPDWGEGVFLDLCNENRTEIRPGMVFHCPQAMRIGDSRPTTVSETILVTEGGCEALTSFAPRDLIVID